MKVYYGKKVLLLFGKGWEIKNKLQDCTKDYYLVQELLHDQQKCTPSFAQKYGFHRDPV